MKRKHFVSILFTLVFVFCIGIYSAFATEISVDSLSGGGSQGVELSVSKDGDIQASLDLEQLEEGIPFEKTITVWIDTDGNFYSNAPSTRAIERLDFTYSGKYSNYRLYNQTWSVTCSSPLIKYVSGDIEYVLDGDVAGDDFFHSDPLAGFSIVHGDIYDFVFPSAYTFPDSIESDILWHVTVISGFLSSEVYNSHTYVVK